MPGAQNGSPVWGADYRPQTLAEALHLPAGSPLPSASPTAAEAAWSQALYGAPVLLLQNVRRARELLWQALALPRGTAVAVPANVTGELANTLKDSGARLHFVDWLPDLTLAECVQTDVVWAEPVGGLLGRPGQRVDVLDCADTAPVPDAPLPDAVAGLWGLHLHTDPEQSGALLAFAPDAAGCALQAAARRLLRPADVLNGDLALAQLRRLADRLVMAQTEVLGETLRGLLGAAGLPVKTLVGACGLPPGIAVQIPEECEPSAFVAYVRGERTPIQWLAELRPMHYAALRAHPSHPGLRRAAAHLARWLLVPVGPAFTLHEISNAVLGVVKAADYLGLRWRTDPARAAEYAALMTEWYGEGHDAYRPAFALDEARRVERELL